MKNKFTAVIERTNTGFSGYIKEEDGIVTVGESITEIKENFIDALSLNFTENLEIEYLIDLDQFFEFYNVLNKSAFADYIGMNRSLFRQYTKGLATLSDDRLLQISKGLHKLANEFSDIALVKC